MYIVSWFTVDHYYDMYMHKETVKEVKYPFLFCCQAHTFQQSITPADELILKQVQVQMDVIICMTILQFIIYI